MQAARPDTVYLDVCSICRPYDDLSIDRNRLEAEAVFLILKQVRSGRLRWVSSEVVKLELEQIRDTRRRRLVSSFLSLVSEEGVVNPSIQRRARELEQASIQPFDALHAACAEAFEAEYLITTDRSLERRLHQIKNLAMKAINPIAFLQQREEA